MSIDSAKEPTPLKDENARFKRLLADRMLRAQALKEIAKGKFLSSAVQRRAASTLQRTLGLSQRRACRYVRMPAAAISALLRNTLPVLRINTSGGSCVSTHSSTRVMGSHGRTRGVLMTSPWRLTERRCSGYGRGEGSYPQEGPPNASNRCQHCQRTCGGRRTKPCVKY